MQCASCRFENMPGSQNCARCGSMMNLATQVIDVHPPRAKRWVKPVRRVTSSRYVVSERMRQAMSQMDRVRFQGKEGPPFTLGLLVRLLVPGWGQFYLERPVRGYIFMCLAGVFAICALVFVGTTLGSLTLGLLFSIHAGSISDAIMPPGSSIGASIGGGLIVYILLGLCIYLPVMGAIGHFVRPFAIYRDIAPFSGGDVLLIRPGSAFHRGQVVLYSRNGERVEIRPHTYLELGGAAIDRILAGPGDHLRATKDAIFVNDVQVHYHPLNSTTISPIDVTVPPNSYFIWPSVANQYSGANLSGNAMIDQTSITGAVVFRTSPWSRAGFIR